MKSSSFSLVVDFNSIYKFLNNKIKETIPTTRKNITEGFSNYINNNPTIRDYAEKVFSTALHREMNIKKQTVTGNVANTKLNKFVASTFSPKNGQAIVNVELGVSNFKYNREGMDFSGVRDAYGYYHIDERAFNNFDVIYKWVRNRRLKTIYNKKVRETASKNNWSVEKIQKTIARMIYVRNEKVKHLRSNRYIKQDWFDHTERHNTNEYTHNTVMRQVIESVTLSLTKISFSNYIKSLGFRHVRRHRRK